MNVLLVDPLPPIMLERIRPFFGDRVTLQTVPSYDEADYARLAPAADILMVIMRRIDARMLALAPKVRFVQRCGVGYDNLDLGALKAAGVRAAYTPGANAVPVAEHTITLMLALLKRLVPADQATRAGAWPMHELIGAGLGDLAGATVGLVGMGNIGQAVAQRLQAFGARLLYNTRRRADPALEEKYGLTYAALPDLLAESAIVSLHAPHTPETRGLIGAPELQRMRQGALLINTSRGELIDEQALRQAILSGHLGGAALDVLHREAPGGNPFADLPQVIVTPHLGGGTAGALQRTMQMAVANVLRFAAGQQPVDLIPESAT